MWDEVFAPLSPKKARTPSGEIAKYKSWAWAASFFQLVIFFPYRKAKKKNGRGGKI